MPFIDNILNYKTLSIVGLEKNTGKTECMNYVIKQLKNRNIKFAITSIGIDGESTDLVTNTQKPEIELFENTIFVTSEMHYKQRKILSEVMDVGSERTSLGRLVTARSLSRGTVILSGPSNTSLLKQYLQKRESFGVDLFIVDGALSRLSSGSPAVSECIILNTGAAVSANIQNLVSKTEFICNLIHLPLYDSSARDQMLDINNGIWAVDKTNNIHDLKIPSVFLLEKYKDKLFEHGHTLYASGAVSDNMLEFLRAQKECSKTVLIVKDFTRLFISKESYSAFVNKGGKINVLLKTKLIAVCVNPTSPAGYNLNSEELQKAISAKINTPVYDVRNI